MQWLLSKLSKETQIAREHLREVEDEISKIEEKVYMFARAGKAGLQLAQPVKRDLERILAILMHVLEEPPSPGVRVRAKLIHDRIIKLLGALGAFKKPKSKRNREAHRVIREANRMFKRLQEFSEFIREFEEDVFELNRYTGRGAKNISRKAFQSGGKGIFSGEKEYEYEQQRFKTPSYTYSSAKSASKTSRRRSGSSSNSRRTNGSSDWSVLPNGSKYYGNKRQSSKNGKRYIESEGEAN